MHVHILQLVEGARQARGATVVIDVFRAFSTACHAFLGGCARIFPVLDVDEARSLAASLPGSLLMGERFTRKLPGFDLGNSPTEVARADVRGRAIVHTTHAGTRGLEDRIREEFLRQAILASRK